MARQHGPLKLTGTLGDLSFYYNKKYGYLARQKGGARKGNLSPRTQENSNEFGVASRVGKLIRRGLYAGLHFDGDSTVSQRLSGCLNQVLQLDSTSARGARTVANGLLTTTGGQLLSSFAFIEGLPLERVLRVRPAYSDDGTFLFPDFDPRRDLSYPAGTTHVQLQGATVFVDGPTDSYRAFSTEVCVVRLHTAADVVLRSPQVPDGKGFRLAAIGIAFLQEVNGELVVLEGRSLGVTR